MKQIGINIWSGNPIENFIYQEIQRHSSGRKRKEQIELNGLLPSERFFWYAKKIWKQPFKWDPTWFRMYVAEEYAVMNLERVEQKQYWDIDGVGDFVVKLDSLMVVDLYQGRGIGRKVIEQIKEICEKAGVIVILFVSPFGFVLEGCARFSGFTTTQELIEAFISKRWEVGYRPLVDHMSIKSFYEEAGFKNVCLTGKNTNPDRFKEVGGWMLDYAYIPSTISQEHLASFQHRLNPEVCGFCGGLDELINKAPVAFPSSEEWWKSKEPSLEALV